MSVLILHRGPLAPNPYHEWLADYDGELLLLASKEHLRLFNDGPPPQGSYGHVEVVERYDTSGYVEGRALELAGRHRLTHIVATQERDLERAAHLRQVLDLPGQKPDSASAFRDKLHMRRFASAAGIAVPVHAVLQCATDVMSFARQHGYPVVVKPRNGGGSIGLHIIANEHELISVASEPMFTVGAQPNYLVEQFIPGSMCHVDGLVIGGQLLLCWASQYQYSLASFRSDRHGRYDVALDPDDPLSRRLRTLATSALDALPAAGDHTFHAEVFHTPDDRLVLCEIACRTGGASIREVGRAQFGIDPTEWWVRRQAGLDVPESCDRGPLRPARLAGQLAFMKRSGTVLRVPGPPPFSWVERYHEFVEPGQVMDDATSSGDFLAVYVVSAPTCEITEERLRQLEAWFDEGFVCEPALETCP